MRLWGTWSSGRCPCPFNDLYSPFQPKTFYDSIQIAQINGDICFLTADKYAQILVTDMDYFSKWTKDKPLQDKLPKSVEGLWIHQTFMCIRTNQRSMQGICQSGKWWNALAGDRQQFARAHNCRGSKLVKWQNWTVKDKSLKVGKMSSLCLALTCNCKAKTSEFFTLTLCHIENLNNLLIYITYSVTASL